MIYLGGVTLGYFNLYPVGFQPKDESARRADRAGLMAAVLRLLKTTRNHG